MIEAAIAAAVAIAGGMYVIAARRDHQWRKLGRITLPATILATFSASGFWAGARFAVSDAVGVEQAAAVAFWIVAAGGGYVGLYVFFHNLVHDD